MTESEWYDECAEARQAQLRGEDVRARIQELAFAAEGLDVRVEPLAHMLTPPREPAVG